MSDPGLQNSVLHIPLGEIQESPRNPRRVFDEAALADLAASIQTHGVLVPVLVRSVDEHYEVIAGARRLRAAQRAGLLTIPAILHEATDDAALEATIVENLQREHVPPLDEARGFRALMDFTTGRHTAASIAARLGKPERYVWNRLRLLELIPKAQRLVTEGRLPVQHAELLSQLTPADQARALDRSAGGVFERDGSFSFDEETPATPYATVKPRSVRELRAWIGDHVRFDPAHFAAAAPLDFGPVLDRVQAATEQSGRGRKVIAITHDHFVKPDARAEERTYCVASWKRADGQEKSKTCDRSVLGVVVVGPGYGEAFAVCVHKDCDVHWKAERLAREKRAKAHTSGESARSADRYAEEDQKERARQEQQEAARAAWHRAEPAIIKGLALAVRDKKPLALASLVLGRDRPLAAKQFGQPKTVDALVRQVAFLILVRAMKGWNANETFPALAKKTLGVDVAKILKAQARGTPGACRVCGCTEEASCAGGCVWADATKTLCTRCVGRGHSAVKKTARSRK